MMSSLFNKNELWMMNGALSLTSVSCCQVVHLGWSHASSAISNQGRTDHLETQALPEGPGSVGGPMRCPWYLFHRLF
ncbi:unnamed protein product [Staurois parvus]|uniref:Secreted protein n=1 Tax=Staurois parvus TaxID=386267 RepID=A0ABN9HP29_9NEOB|nr:unnamed protein product [Staurois parvus]